ncbi:hypothetical protein EUREKA_46 [Mycobacterium phage Eureka]|uniref:Uncharacterized protein n=2 Tax=Kostyavirus eureka TaxID=1074306 RepID=G1JWR6_9CAUD|nr:hypothetical protein GOKU_46 [Mycobacterium phage Goku]YP_009591586.1 hypothetical protein FDG60_gp046 [Mycobacterium phage Eureka]AEL98064.1 hypothetical protein EUREKA_46 [Mycobacterium phage Eureka]AGT14155.1 hypothetical protein GOKU_46 [Mycobacterium phage Goku]AYQ99733.1 hypothetical protein PBI_MANDA_48 [Mycobacterium phage Manda]
MKYIENKPGKPILELTRRNLETLLKKLGDPLSARTLLAPGGDIYVRAVEDDEHYGEREPGPIYMPSTGERV